MSVESDGEIDVTMEDANAYFDYVSSLRRPNGKKMSQTEKGKILGVNQSTFSRNAARRKSGRDISNDMYVTIADILRGKRREARRQRLLKEQAEADRAAEAKREADEKEKLRDIKAKERADREKVRQREAAADADRERHEDVLRKLKPYWDRMSADGIFNGLDPASQGDAPELLKGAQPADISYMTFEMAMIALAPAGFKFTCGMTAAQLRQGRSAWHRLKGKYPKWTDKCEAVSSPLRPDAALHYGEDYQDVLIWQQMNTEHRALVLDSLPLVVSFDTAKACHEFVSLDERLYDEGHRFMDSCLDECGDVEARLRQIYTRTILPIAGAGVLKALKWAGSFLAILAMVAAALAVLFIFVFTLWQIVSWAVDTAVSVWRALVAWVDSVKWYIVGVTAHGVPLGLGVWWAWPKESDRRNYPRINMAARRFLYVGAFTVLYAAVILFFHQLEASFASYEAFERFIGRSLYFPWS